jgi:hypothetical protein
MEKVNVLDCASVWRAKLPRTQGAGPGKEVSGELGLTALASLIYIGLAE